MSKINPNPPPSPEPIKPHKTNTRGEPTFGKGGQIDAKPLTWLGMTFTGKEAQQLWSSIIQTIGNQITKDKEKAIKQLKKDWGDDQDS